MACSFKKWSHEVCMHLFIIMFYFLSDKEQIDNKNPSLAEDQVHQHLKDWI